MKSKNWNKEEFIKNYQQLKSSRKMAELYNCDRKTITAFAKKIGYDYSNNKENYFRHNLFYIINDINKYFGLSSNINYSDSIEDIYNKVREKTY